MITWNRYFFHSPSRFLMELIILMHDYVIIFLVSILVMVIVVITFPFFNKFYNLEFFENHQLETLWTLAPFILLVFVIIPSLNSLYVIDACFFCGLTLNITGHQWYWSYFYKDFSHMFDSYMLTSESRKIRLLEVDNRLIIPNSIPLRFFVSSADVIHSWTIPSFGVKIDALPGRINQFCFSTKRRGIFFGQCSEICGVNHRFIPIVVEVFPTKEFLSLFWLFSLFQSFYLLSKRIFNPEF